MLPKQITAGDTISFTESVSGYAPEDGWALSYTLVTATKKIEITSSDNGDGLHLVAETAANTALYAPDDYNWQSYVTKAAERFSVATGAVTIKPNFAGSARDARSHVKKTLDAIESLIEGKAGKDVDSYSIQGRSLSKMNITELLEWRDKYKRELAQLEKEADLAAGIGSSNKVYTRLVV